MIQGIIDIGSNTIRLAVYKIENDTIEQLIKKKHVVGLASYIRDGIMLPEGIDKACDIVNEFKVFLNQFQIHEVVAFTTAALRNAKNGRAAVDEIIARTGVDVHIITGDEEANFDFIGATHMMKEKDGIIIDVGGGSTELIAYSDRMPVHMISMPIGSLAMYTQYVKGILPTAVEIAEIREAVKLEFAKAENFQNKTFKFICGIGGTFKAAKILNNKMYDMPEENAEVPCERICKMINYLQCDSDAVETAKLDLLINNVPDRIKTVVPGMVIVDTLATYFNSSEIVYSDSGVREGYLYEKIIKKNK